MCFSKEPEVETGGRGSGQYLRTGESSQVTPENKKELDAFKSSVTESDDYVDNRVRSYGIQNVFGGDEKAYTDFLESQRTGLGGQISGGLNALRNLSITNAIFGGGKKAPADPFGDNMQRIFSYAAGAKAGVSPGGVTRDAAGNVIIDTGTGKLKVRENGMTTYSGLPNPDYDGPFSNLVNPPVNEDDDSAVAQSTPLDPCPDGFKFNPATQSCEPVAAEAATDLADKPTFTRNPTPLSTAFPDLTRYGREGGEYQFFASMPGVPDPNLAEGGPPRGPQGEVTGPGGPKDDLVGPFMLSSREYVMPYEMVLDEGQGSYDKGIKSLEQQRMAALKKYKARAASS